MKKSRFIFMLIFSLWVDGGFAKTNSWLESHEQGWHWYHDPKIINKKTPAPTPPSVNQSSDPLEEVKLYKEKLERLQSAAIMRPTIENVHAYLKAQVAATERASYFSVVWNEVLRRHPELDYNVQFPATQYARNIYLDSEKEQLDLLMKQFSKQYGFILFIKGNCKFCHAMAPIVERVAKEYGIYVTYRSLDGGFMANLPNQVKDNGVAARMQITQVPALVAVDPNRDQWFPIVFGAVSEIELKEQIQAHLEYLVAQDQKVKTTIARLNPGEPNAQIDLAN